MCILIAARGSPAKTSFIVENPADRSITGSPQFTPELADHGALFATTAIQRLQATLGPLGTCTFAGCRLGGAAQKYTTLLYTPELAPELNILSAPSYQCNHPRGTHKEIAGGRGPGGQGFVSAASAVYPAQLTSRLARAFSQARTGSTDNACARRDFA